MIKKGNETRTKIVATIGPATSSKENLEKLFLAGVNVCRLNFSHGSYDDHLEVINNILAINEKLGTHVAMLADLQGPKLRIGEVENNGVLLEPGKEISFVNEKCMGNAEKVYMSYTLFPQDVKIGDFILIDDGKLKLQATYTDNKTTVKAKVIYGGILSSKKGVNLPNTNISLPSLTEKDIQDAHFALEHNVDWIALSFVRKASDVTDLKKIVAQHKKLTRVIAKIEKPEAIVEIDKIIKAADGIMVARGDLGVELPFNQVPVMQKMIVDKCIKYARPVIIATQMMESMITNFSPTRAEANDVANAVIDGASALMLSGETSVGKYPSEVIKAMKEIIAFTEANGYKYYHEYEHSLMDDSYIPDSICAAACTLAKQSSVRTMVVFTMSGFTASKIASHRPNATVYAFTPNKDLIRQMSLLWGVIPMYSPMFQHANEAVDYSKETLLGKDAIFKNELVVHVGSIPTRLVGETNMVKLTRV